MVKKIDQSLRAIAHLANIEEASRLIFNLSMTDKSEGLSRADIVAGFEPGNNARVIMTKILQDSNFAGCDDTNKFAKCVGSYLKIKNSKHVEKKLIELRRFLAKFREFADLEKVLPYQGRTWKHLMVLFSELIFVYPDELGAALVAVINNPALKEYEMAAIQLLLDERLPLSHNDALKLLGHTYPPLEEYALESLKGSKQEDLNLNTLSDIAQSDNHSYPARIMALKFLFGFWPKTKDILEKIAYPRFLDQSGVFDNQYARFEMDYQARYFRMIALLLLVSKNEARAVREFPNVLDGVKSDIFQHGPTQLADPYRPDSTAPEVDAFVDAWFYLDVHETDNLMYKYISSAGDRNEVLNGTSGRLAAVGAIIERLGKKGDPLARSLARDYLAHVETVSDHTREKKYYYKQPTLLIGAAGAFQGICLDQKDKDLSIMVLKDFITDHHGDNPHTRDWALDQLFILNDKEAVAIAKKLFLIEESWYRSRMHKLSIIIMGDGLENSEINTAISFIEIFLLEKYLKQTFSEFDFPADSDALFYALTSLTFISPEKYKKLIGLLKRAWVRHEAEKQTPPLLFGSSRIFNIDALFSYLMSRI